MYSNNTTSNLKRSILEAYEPHSPPHGPERELQSRPSAHGASGDMDMPQAPLLEGAASMDPDVPQAQEVYKKDGTEVEPLHYARESGKEAAIAQDPLGVQVATKKVKKIYIDGQFVAVRMMWSTTLERDMPSRPSENENENENENGTQPAKSHSAAENPRGKDRAMAADSDSVDNDIDTSDNHDPAGNPIPPRPSHLHRRGWGLHPDEEFFHTVPSPHGKSDRNRVVFRLWPRKSDDKPLADDVVHPGTLSPDGYPWGATLYDFYNVRKSPSDRYHQSIMTGSQLCQTMDALRESRTAVLETEWAMSEGQPRVEGAADTEELIRNNDKILRVLPLPHPSHDTSGENKVQQKGEQKEEKVDYDGTQSICIPPPSTIPVKSPFHPSHYPKPWPFTPFENDLSILLQERIPLHLLPQNLYVHDPFCLLTAREEWFHNTSWTSRPDIVRTYNLQLSEHVRAQCEDARKTAEELATFKSRTLIILRYRRTEEQVKDHEPIIEVPLPPYPLRATKTEDAHLYISPVAKAGKGHHSIVYKGEWELPREIFSKQRICPLCFKESVGKEIQRLKDTGRWDRMLRAASPGPNGFGGRQLAMQIEQDTVNNSDLTNLARNGETVEREITCIVSPDAAPSQIMEMMDQTDTWDELMKNPEVNQAGLWFGNDHDDKSTQGVPVVRIDPPFSYESQQSCTHGTSDGPVPHTAKFTVVAKLSLEGDPHLSREAKNYQKFPERFFQHYNGYTFMRELDTIVPVNAVVPQFYGYYTPHEDPARNPRPAEQCYLSPILLLEHCGKPIDPERLVDEDQEECKSLLLRFHRAGWLHESVAPRNFLVQQGKPTEFPHTRERKPELSFRLIDFGWSRMCDSAEERQVEEGEVRKMFDRTFRSLELALSLRDSMGLHPSGRPWFWKIIDGHVFWE